MVWHEVKKVSHSLQYRPLF